MKNWALSAVKKIWGYNIFEKSSSIRMHNLDVLKGACVIFVVLTHVKMDATSERLMLFPFWVEMAVPIFMIISGYVVAKSNDRRGFSGLCDALSPVQVIPFFLRFLLPFLLFFPFEVRYAIKKASVSGVGEFLLKYLSGGWGPGGYYVCMMFQFVILFPLVWHFIRRFRLVGLSICFALNLLYEILQWHIGMNDMTYRLLIFRHLAVISFGAFLAEVRFDHCLRFAGVFRWLMLIAGGIYITLNSYFDYRPVFITQWPTVCLFAGLFAMAVVWFWIEKVYWIKFQPLAIIGMASYEVFLFQKIFYLLWAKKLFKHITLCPAQCICSIVICCVIGVLLHRITSGYFSRFISFVKNRL